MTIVRPVLCEVRSSQRSIESRTCCGTRVRSPTMRIRTLFFMKISSSSEVSISVMRAATSSAGRFQFSVEKV